MHTVECFPKKQGKEGQGRALGILREAKPGGFQTRVFPPLFSGKVQIVSWTLSGLFLVGALNRPRKRKRTKSGKSPDHPRANREKSQENQESPKKDKKGTKKEGQVQIGKPPRLKPPRLAGLEFFVSDFGAFLVQRPERLGQNKFESPK